jgi:hypothetical protein
MNVPYPVVQPDIRFGFPSSEKGTSFKEATNCQFYEALQYTSSNVTRTEYSNGDLDDCSFVSWFEKVSSFGTGSVGVLLI